MALHCGCVAARPLCRLSLAAVRSVVHPLRSRSRGRFLAGPGFIAGDLGLLGVQSAGRPFEQSACAAARAGDRRQLRLRPPNRLQ